ncbi:MAG: rod shape-determining protein MreD [Ignavibacteriales bacterium]|jgi:rod shape-determining protein MreD|nr:rod shape-determining protein MreD [Ignavibacteriales bacterium]MBP7542899.1 rod shape-determining protein MreD [Ignavibacteriaceae bacterium]MBK7266565.1 rod shape-determining protein MreD [Ignavibacteriales bacterium]MBK8660293.1 rod shape-determining protein MreD [Ignavibacteriales bacterium]MBP9122263.1 rod shape-determining protein MreD [Ignavibacteriaceae bacterium]
MNNNKYLKYLLPVAYLIPLLFVQVVFVPFISIETIIPDLILILVVHTAVKHGQIPGTLFGFGAGLIFDLVTGNMLASSALAKTLAGFTAGYFSTNRIDINLGSYRFIFIIVLAAFINSSTFALVTNFDLNNNFLKLIFEQGITPALYTGFVSAIWVFTIPKKQGDWLK